MGEITKLTGFCLKKAKQLLKQKLSTKTLFIQVIHTLSEMHYFSSQLKSQF